MKLVEQDNKLIWHPFTQHKTADLPILIKRGSGSYLYDQDDNAYLDLISSWWVNLHGHANLVIAEAIFQQAKTLEHVIFAGFTHEPAVKLCEKISSWLPSSLSRFFFSDNGSTSVEVALKMAYQYWLNKSEQQRKFFVCFEGGYHGDTFGAMSVGSTSGFHDVFKKLFFETLSIPFPATWDDDPAFLQKEEDALSALQTQIDLHENEIAAVILEPLVQGASGMRMCRPLFVQKVMQLVKSHGILVIFDEVMTGFGRTGQTFALDHVGMAPDFLCLSKGITGGFMPLALTVTTEEMYSAFLSEHSKKAFLHGHSYTANPIACAAAVASCTLLESSEVKKAIADIQCAHRNGLALLNEKLNNVINARMVGTIAAFDVVNEDCSTLNQRMKHAFLEKKLLLRPLENTVYLLPPYCASVSDIELAYTKICEVLRELD